MKISLSGRVASAVHIVIVDARSSALCQHAFGCPHANSSRISARPASNPAMNAGFTHIILYLDFGLLRPTRQNPQPHCLLCEIDNDPGTAHRLPLAELLPCVGARHLRWGWRESRWPYTDR